MDWPAYMADQLILGNPESDLAIVCGWTPRERIRKLCAEIGVDYAVIGNLYSGRRGLTPLIRNLFLNPKITQLALVGANLSNSLNQLAQILNGRMITEGYKEDNGQLVFADGEGSISANISIEALQRLPFTISTHSLWEGGLSLEKQILEINHRTQNIHLEPRDLQSFPEDESILPESWPDRYAGHVIHGTSVVGVWAKGLQRIRRYGSVSSTQYGVQQQELYNVMTIIDGDYFAESDMRYAESVSDLELPFDWDAYQEYRKQILTAEVFEGVAYTYGVKIWTWLEPSIINKLQENPDDRSAIISLWSDDNYFTSKDNPCLTQLHFRKDPRGRLAMTATFRSHDYWNAYVQNVWALREMQMEAAQMLNWDLGETIVISQSAHIYEDCWDVAERTYGVALKDTRYNPHPHTQWDPRGQFIIEVDDSGIHVTLIAPESVGGYPLKSWTETRAARLGAQILQEQVLTDPSHALYLGRQLAEAEHCFVHNTPYHQA